MKLNNIFRSLALCALAHQALGQTEVDVVVVGAGLSGLAAARVLRYANASFAVVEARDRVGGKVLNKKLKNGGVTELGAAFVGPTQDRVLALKDELGLQTFDEFNTGNNIAAVDGKVSPYNAATSIPSLGLVTSVEFLEAIAKIDLMASLIDVEHPWNSTFAHLWDSQSFQTWVNTTVTTQSAIDTLLVATQAIFSADPSEMSLLYVLSYVAGSGNATNTGTFERLFAVEQGAQEQRIVGGSGQLPIGLANIVGLENIYLSNPVTAIDLQSSGKYLVTGENGTFLANQVIVAMSPPLAGQITYTPALPEARQQIQNLSFMGSLAKANAFFDTPFWRDADLTGQIIADHGTVCATFDDSDANATYGGLIGFVESGEATAINILSESDIIERVSAEYVKYFGPQAANATEWVIQRWNLEPYSQGGPTAVFPPNSFAPYGSALRDPCEGIFWAGTEGSDYWPGYMDGAIRSGERAAIQLLNLTIPWNQLLPPGGLAGLLPGILK